MAVHKRQGKKGVSYYYAFSVGGQRYRDTVGPDKEEAKRAEARRRLEVENGTALMSDLSRPNDNSADSPFMEYAQTRYLNWSRLHKKSWQDDVYHLETFRGFFGDMTFAGIIGSPGLLDDFMAQRLSTPTKHGQKRSPTSVNREIELLSSIFSLAIVDKVVISNPCKNVQKFPEDNQRERYLTPDEEERLFAQLEGSREHLRPIVLLAIHTGLRRGEIFSLEWSRVDFLRRVIYVVKTKSRRNRFVPMNDIVRAELLKLREQCDGSGEVFRTFKTGQKFVDIKKAFRAACKDAGIEDLHFHDLRHTTASRLGELGTAATTIADILGHSDLRMTQRYTHATDPGKRRAMDDLAKYGQPETECQKLGRLSERRTG